MKQPVVAVLAVVVAILLAFGAGVYVQHRVTVQCARAADGYRDGLSDLANRADTERFDLRAFLERTQEARAAHLRCQAGGL